MADDEEDDEAPSAPTAWSRLRDFVRQHRRRLQLAAIAVFVVAVVVELGGAVPREVAVAVPIGAGHADVTEARIEYTQEDEEVRSVTLRWPRGAPSDVRDTVELSPGEYDVSVTLVKRDGETRRLTGRLRAPADGVVRLALEGT